MSFTLVTGGAKNLGREICLTLAKNNFNVAIHYNQSEKEAFLLAEECRSFGTLAEVIQGDFSNIANVNKFIENYKRQCPSTKNVVNNVGNYLIKGIGMTSIEEMADLFQVNLYVPFLLIQALLPELIQEKGSIVNIGVAGIDEIKSENYSTAYSMTKQSLLMLTKSFAKELCSMDVTCNMVSPGILEGSIDAPKDSHALPMKRVGTYREVADVVMFLLQQKNHYITGQNIEVAGGVRL